MPSCRPDIIPEVIYKVMDMNPQTILDVGMGCGKWGLLCHEYLKYWKDTVPVIDGIEVFEDYKNPAYSIYRKVYYGDVMDLLSIVGDYDLVMVMDVIEHLTRENGFKLIDSIKNHYIISTPGYWSAQGANFGNKYERHISRWKQTDFKYSLLIPDRVGRRQIIGWK